MLCPTVIRSVSPTVSLFIIKTMSALFSRSDGPTDKISVRGLARQICQCSDGSDVMEEIDGRYVYP